MAAGVLAVLAAATLLAVFAYERLRQPAPDRAEATPTAPTPTPGPSPVPSPSTAPTPEAARVMTADALGVLVRGCGLCKVAAGADGETVASTGGDNVIRVWRAGQQSAVRKLSDAKRPGSSVTISPDGSTIVAGDDGGALLVWQA